MRSPDELRRHASQLLALALKARDQGQIENAEQLMTQAIKYLNEIGAPHTDTLDKSISGTDQSRHSQD